MEKNLHVVPRSALAKALLVTASLDRITIDDGVDIVYVGGGEWNTTINTKAGTRWIRQNLVDDPELFDRITALLDTWLEATVKGFENNLSLRAQQLDAGEAYLVKRIEDLQERSRNLTSSALPCQEDDFADFTFNDHGYVYLLIRDGVVVYVGQTVNMESRMQQHLKDKRFDQVKCKRVALTEINRIELSFIKKYQPEYNRAGLTHPFHDSSVT